MATPVVTCGECGKVAGPVDGSVIYPHRPELHGKRYFLCACGAYVGAHENDGRPLGKPANLATRRARRNAHLAFDRIWQGKIKSRKRAYEWLAEQLGINPLHCHIGLFDQPTALRVTRIANAYWNSLDAAEIEAAQKAQAKGGRAAKRDRKGSHGARRKAAMLGVPPSGRNRPSRHGVC